MFQYSLFHVQSTEEVVPPVMSYIFMESNNEIYFEELYISSDFHQNKIKLSSSTFAIGRQCFLLLSTSQHQVIHFIAIKIQCHGGHSELQERGGRVQQVHDCDHIGYK